MDLIAVEHVLRPATRAHLPPWRERDVVLAGGTGLFSEPQPDARRLIDLHALGWPPLEVSAAGLRIAATCTLAEAAAARLPPAWTAAPLIGECCRALAGSFKVWNAATVGGNVCMALPAAPMLTLTVALDGVATIWLPGGGERHAPMAEFAVGPQRTVLRPGEILRAIDLPAAAMRRRVALRQASLTALGRSAALLAASVDPRDGAFRLVVTASTVRPVLMTWPALPVADTLDDRIATLPDDMWFDDVHGAPAWRRHMTRRLAAELLHDVAA